MNEITLEEIIQAIRDDPKGINPDWVIMSLEAVKGKLKGVLDGY